ncbi:prephenate dehydrogenase [Demequina sp. SYSU T00068]|uniref:prephenate dehydrogenase n=1 Tax=Demequina lignilytica TaxID=3051663 RepID=UPI002633C0A7|nr:prephenate dehydrogenase [Demequina sp. SYSU T00068]MDN4489220.1 prephenate dehydrogenase [Demequina sp. SYSU T00068]
MSDTLPRTHIVGAGLIGASIGIGLSAEGWPVTIADADAQAEALARSIGAGGTLGEQSPDLVIVATPPSVAGAMVVHALRTWPDAVVTDVASVKAPIAEAADATGQGARYVGSHPMAGRELSGGLAAQGDLFKARPWVICPNGAAAAAVELVLRVPAALQCDVVTMEAAAHDAAVARVSHAPQVAASAVAAALGALHSDDVALAGQGLRDVTRIAGSAPGMWADIARLNRGHLVETLDHIIADLEDLRESDDIGEAVTDLIERGRFEVARIPGKHGGATRDWAGVTVIVPDEPGHLLKLLGDTAQVDVNVEDITIEHSPRQPVGLTTLYVLPSRAAELVAALESQGWEIAAS